jgi:hypothetical protein
MSKRQKPIVEAYLKMWPREALNLRDGKRRLPLKDVWSLFDRSGVYVLYRDDQPYYIGRAKKISKRIHDHANRPEDKHYNFWNFFSAFLVADQRHISEVEGILIAASPTENAAVPRFFKKLSLPAKVARLIHAQRLISIPRGEA